jgi:hypothetical protein
MGNLSKRLFNDRFRLVGLDPNDRDKLIKVCHIDECSYCSNQIVPLIKQQKDGNCYTYKKCGHCGYVEFQIIDG